MKRSVTCFLGLFLVGSTPAADSETLKLWNGAPPLATPNDKPEAYLPLDAGMDPDITRLGTRPIITPNGADLSPTP